jgi:hypothetical protein
MVFDMNDFYKETDVAREIVLSDKKVKYKKHKTTKKRIIEFYGTDFDKERTEQKEIDWGKPVGKEIWQTA